MENKNMKNWYNFGGTILDLDLISYVDSVQENYGFGKRAPTWEVSVGISFGSTVLVEFETRNAADEERERLVNALLATEKIEITTPATAEGANVSC